MLQLVKMGTKDEQQLLFAVKKLKTSLIFTKKGSRIVFQNRTPRVVSFKPKSLGLFFLQTKKKLMQHPA